jgi:hypothetical protein
MEDQPRDQVIFSPEGRYISLHGGFIDQLGTQSHSIVSEECIKNRKIRDGEGHHITVINHLEIGTFISKEESSASNTRRKKAFKKHQLNTYNALRNKFGLVSEWEMPEDLGMGICTHQDAIAYFRVVHWPFGQMMRSYLGLKRSNFHITVGFSPHDVHLYKGPASLLCLKSGQPCTQEIVARLIGLVYFYAEDKKFIKALYKTCWRHGYYKQFFRLTVVHIIRKCEAKCLRKYY